MCKLTVQNAHLQQVDHDLNTPLHLACKHNRISVAILLVQYGANANTENKAGWTPLHVAASQGHAELIRQLARQSDAEVSSVKRTCGLCIMH